MAKKSIGWAKYAYVCEWDMCWRNFCNFPWWLEAVKSRSKIALFSNERHFEIWFPKRKTITFFGSKLSKLHKKDPILHVATTFFLKQGETRTSHGPIPHPLTSTSTIHSVTTCCKFWLIFSYFSSNFSYFLPHFCPIEAPGELPIREGPGYATAKSSQMVENPNIFP